MKVSHICNFGSYGIVKSTRHVCDRPEFTANGIALKLLRDRFAFWCLIKTKIKKIMNFLLDLEVQLSSVKGGRGRGFEVEVEVKKSRSRLKSRGRG